MDGKHFIFDFETMGQDQQKCVTLECSYMTFDTNRFCSDNPYTFDELISESVRDKFKARAQMNEQGYILEPGTVQWWKEQSKEVRERVLNPTDEDITIREFCDNIIEYLSKTKPYYWWSRSNTFDPIILQRLMTDLGLWREFDEKKLLKFWAVRDVRTYIDAKFNFAKGMQSFIPMKDEERWNRVYMQHNSQHDIAGDILRFQTILRSEAGMDVPE